MTRTRPAPWAPPPTAASDGGADVSSGLSDAVGGSDWPGDSDAEPDAVGDVDWLGESLVDGDGDLLGERVGLGSDAVIDPLGEGRSTDPSSPHEVRSMTSISPANGIAAARIRIVRTVIIVAEAFLRNSVAIGRPSWSSTIDQRLRRGGCWRAQRQADRGQDDPEDERHAGHTESDHRGEQRGLQERRVHRNRTVRVVLGECPA